MSTSRKSELILQRPNFFVLFLAMKSLNMASSLEMNRNSSVCEDHMQHSGVLMPLSDDLKQA